MGFDAGGVDHLRICRSTVAGELPEQVFPDAAPRPPSEAIVDRRRRPIGFGTIAPAAAAFQHVYDTADDAATILPLDAGTSVGKWGSIHRHCPSLSQNKFPLTIPILPLRESVSYCHSRKLIEFSP
jgi:hypothetical protein